MEKNNLKNNRNLFYVACFMSVRFNPGFPTAFGFGNDRKGDGFPPFFCHSRPRLHEGKLWRNPYELNRYYPKFFAQTP